MRAEEELIRQTKLAEAEKQSAILLADKVRVEAEARRDAAEKETAAIKMLAEAESAKQAASGLAQARVQEARAVSLQKEGLAEANVSLEKYRSEAMGITEKAEAMKKLDSVGKDHEEFKLRLEKEQNVEIAAINAQKSIAESQAGVVGEALRAARIDIIGGDGQFFEQITSAVKGGKAIDRFVYNSRVATDIKETFFDGNADYFREKVMGLVDEFHLSTDDIKDLSIAALIAKLLGLAKTDDVRGQLTSLLGLAGSTGVADQKVSKLVIDAPRRPNVATVTTVNGDPKDAKKKGS
jgi:hypothetical protein